MKIIKGGICCKIMISSVISLVGLGCLLYFIFNHSVEYPKHQTVVVFFNSTAKIGQTDDDYICATLDWWPSDKCDYGSCSWGMASLLNLVCFFFYIFSFKFLNKTIFTE